ncbi:MAG: AAA family ATPase [Oscillospiraceae bacterium]
MNKVITVSREFGSGGRELGKRLAEILNIAYYDKEVITAISEKSSLAESYVEQIVEQHIVTYYPITIATSFASMPYDAMGQINRSIYSAQAEVLKEMATKSDCVIVGRCADHILREFSPLNLFVYADMPSKIARCREKGGEIADLSDKELQKRINGVDRARAKYYSSYTGRVWGDKLNYDLCVNTTNHSIKMLAESIAHLIQE